MAKVKRYQQARQMVDPEKLYMLDEALELISNMPKSKFDETIDLNLLLVTGKQKETFKTTVNFPHSFGVTKRILVFVKGEKAKEAKDAGADFVGAEDLVEKILSGWLEFDVVLATPETMPLVAKLGKLLGPKGLMPNPKNETVTTDLARVIKEIKCGRKEFGMTENGVVQVSVGKKSHTTQQLKENIGIVFNAILKMKPASEFKNIVICSTMSPAVRIDTKNIRNVF